MIFCQSDWFPNNFIIDSDGCVTAIDFSDASILPSSFAKYMLWEHRLGFDMHERVYIPATEGVDNTEALLATAGPMVMGPSSFSSMGRRFMGGDSDTQQRITDMIKRCADPY